MMTRDEWAAVRHVRDLHDKLRTSFGAVRLSKTEQAMLTLAVGMMRLNHTAIEAERRATVKGLQLMDARVHK